jgi:hypothetical protein
LGLATVETELSVTESINSIDNVDRRKDAQAVLALMKKVTGKKPKIWGNNFMIGFGKYKYKRKGKKEEFEWFNIGFAPRKDKITLYLTCYLDTEPLVEQLGACTYGKGCLHIKKLADINMVILEKLIEKYKDQRWN